VTHTDAAALPDHRLTLTERLLDEGVVSLIEAAKRAGLRPVPCLRTLMRNAITEKLEAIKIGGRWVTSPDAVRRWLAQQQAQRAAAPPARANANAVLGRYGLGRDCPGA
jgi:hypothetical protein